MSPIGLTLSALLVLANAGRAAAVDPPALSSSYSPQQVQPVSAAERKAVQKYRLCVLQAARRTLAMRGQHDDVALRALYSCPGLRANAQNLLIRTYGLSHKQRLFNALDARLTQEVEAEVRAARRPRR